MTKRLLKTATAQTTLALMLGLIAATPQGFAAENESADPAQTANKTAAADPAKRDPKDDPANKKKLKDVKDKDKGKEKEIFRPTEEISEDFAVSFPVDI